jgi:hypothetical protein
MCSHISQVISALQIFRLKCSIYFSSPSVCKNGARGSGVVKAVCYKPKGRRFDIQ